MTLFIALILSVGLVLHGRCSRLPNQAVSAATPTPPTQLPSAAQPLKTDEWVVRYQHTAQCPALVGCQDSLIVNTVHRTYCRYRCLQQPNITGFSDAVIAQSQPVVVPLGDRDPSAECANSVANPDDLSNSMNVALQEQTRRRLFGETEGGQLTEGAPTLVLAIDTANDWSSRQTCTDHRDRSPHARNVVLAARMAACGDAADCGNVTVQSRVGLGVFGARWLDDSDRVLESATLCRDDDVANASDCHDDSKIPRETCTQFNDLVASMALHDRRLHGGYMGTRADLAQAIEAATRELFANPSLRLVINLSVGWHGKHDCDGDCPSRLDDASRSDVRIPALDGMGVKTGSNTPVSIEHGKFDVLTNPESQSVFWAIARARCAGALVIAAAGNAVDEDREGPLMPGGWEQVGFDSASNKTPLDCDALLTPEEQNSGYVARQGSRAIVGQFLYAVAGINAENQLLFNARTESVPRLLAHGQAVAVADPAASETITKVALTGSSMAAATVSGVVAARWSRRPDLTGADVIEDLYGAAASTTSQLEADAQATSMCPSIKGDGTANTIKFERAPSIRVRYQLSQSWLLVRRFAPPPSG